MKPQRTSSPDGNVDGVAQNEDRAEKAAVLSAPHHREISSKHLADLREVVRKEKRANDARVGQETYEKKHAKHDFL